MLAVKSPMVMALECAREMLEQPGNWDKTGEGPGWCPLRAIKKASDRLGLGLITKLRLVFRLRDALPPSHRRWWPECVIRYNEDPAVTHADVLAWLDRAIAAI
jgi:hypothetical protein